MSTVRQNIVANFAGKGWAGVLGLVFPPIYARLLGMESYGLVGVYSSLAGVLSFLDLGLAATLNREIARHSTGDTGQSHRATRDLTRTIEVVFWAVGVTSCVVIVELAPLIAHHWVHAERLPGDTVTNSIRLMGLVFAFQWPVGVYNGGLVGLQKQVTANVVQSVFVTVRIVGAAVILWKVSCTIQAFFIWQGVLAALQTGATRLVLGRGLPGKGPGTFRWGVLAKTWRFSTSLSVVGILTIVLMQADKVIVSRLVTLEQFGYYSLAWAAGSSLTMAIGPVFVAVFPRLSQLIKQEKAVEIGRVYHASCQLVSVIMLPAALVLALFSREVLLAWSGDQRLVVAASGVLVAVSLGTAMNGLINVPYALQLAFGWTRLVVGANVVAVAAIIPLTYWLAKNHGIVGAAAGWTILNAGYVAIMIPLMHRRLLRHEMFRWYVTDVGLPLIGALAITVPLRVLVTGLHGRMQTSAYLLGVTCIAGVAAALVAPEIRNRGLALAGRWRLRYEA